MTLAPLHSVEIRGVEGKPGQVDPHCFVPGCISLSQQRHHFWSKSYLRGQPYEWVRLPDGAVIQNSGGVCIRHHRMVTGGPGGHEAVIVFDQGVLLWAEAEDGEWKVVGPLHPQPQGIEEQGERPPDHSPEAAEHGVLLPGQQCPSCGYTKPRPRKPGPKRTSRTWVVAVPDDAEIGAEVLDDWVDSLAALLGLSEPGQRQSRMLRYHVLAATLAWATQNQAQLIRDVKEVVEA